MRKDGIAVGTLEQLVAAGLHNPVILGGVSNARIAVGLLFVQARRRIDQLVPNQVGVLLGIVLLTMLQLGLRVQAVWFLLTPVIGVALIYARIKCCTFLGSVAGTPAVQSTRNTRAA